jgi:phosphatidylglycerophosphate synthase
MGMKFAPGGHSTFFAMLNAFVHIVMYFYYMIAAMGPKYQKYIWWKKYLTAFQMVKLKSFIHQISVFKTKIFFFFSGPIHRHFHSPIPAAVQRLRISKRLYGVDWPSRHHVLIPLC